MSKSRPNPKVDEYFTKAKKWVAEMAKMREIVLASHQPPLTEELKWGKPCYTLDGANIVLIIGFKEYCAFLFHKGVLLKDPEGILIQISENTQAMRQIRFTSLPQIVKLAKALKGYVQQAIEVQKSGLEVKFKKVAEFVIPEELQKKLDEDPPVNTAFRALTPGRQRAYILHISGAKQARTRESRVEKCLPRILAGKGMDD